jgi:hypothetical protein
VTSDRPQAEAPRPRRRLGRSIAGGQNNKLGRPKLYRPPLQKAER